MDDLDRLYHRLLDAVRDGAPHLRERRFRLGDIPQHLLPYRLHRRELGFEGVQQYERALARLAAGERGYLSADASVQQAFRRAVDAAGAGDGADALAQALRFHGDALVALAPEGRAESRSESRAEARSAAAERGAPPSDRTPSDRAAADRELAAFDAALAARPGTDDVAADTFDAAPDADASDGALVIPIVRVDTSGADAGRAATPAGPTPAVAAQASAPPAAPPPAAPPPAAPPPAAPPPAAPAADAMPFPVRPPAPVVGGRCPHCGRPLPADRGVTFCPYCGENLTVRRCPACSTELEAGWRFCITCGREVDQPAGAGAGP